MRIYKVRSRTTNKPLIEDYSGTDRQKAMNTYLEHSILKPKSYAEIGYICPEGMFIELNNTNPILLSKTNWDGL